MSHSPPHPQPQPDEEQQTPPRILPGSPHLKPRAHRDPSPSASSSSIPTSSTIPYSYTHVPHDASHSPESSSSRSSGSDRSSRGSLNGTSSIRGGHPHRVDLTSSIISNLDLDEGGQSLSPDLQNTVDAEETVEVRADEEVMRRLPLVREDTSTRKAMEELVLSEQGEPSSASTSSQHEESQRGPGHPMFDRLQPPIDPLRSSTDESSGDRFTSRQGGEGGSVGLLFPEDSHNSHETPAEEVEHTDLLSKIRESYQHVSDQHDQQHQPSRDSQEEEDSTRHQPKTTSSDAYPHTETIPTVSSIGMPRLIHRHADDPTRQSHVGSQGPPPKELLPEGSTISDSDSSSPSHHAHTDTHPPTGSLLLASLSPSSHMSFTRRITILSSSLFINLGLPFINGACMGFGETFARSIVSPFVLGVFYARWPALAQGGWWNRANSPPGKDDDDDDPHTVGNVKIQGRRERG